MANKSQSILPEVITGLFVVAVVALLAFFTIIISGVDWLHGKHTVLRQARFEQVGSLRVQDPVHVRGMKVGSVQSLSLGEGCVWVNFRMNADVPLRADASVTVGQTSLLGGSCLVLEPGRASEGLPEGSPLPGKSPVNVMDNLGELVAELREAVDPEDLRTSLANIRIISADLADLSGRARRGEGLVGRLFDPKDTTYDDIQATIANIRTVSGDLREGKGLLGKLLREEDTTYADLQSTLANLREVSDGLRDGKGLLGKLLREDDTAYADLQASLANIREITAKLNNPQSGFGRLLTADSPLIGDLEATAANLKAITAKLESGEGTLGRLVNDQAIADEVEAAIRDVRQIIDNMRDTAPITTFSSLFFSGM
ncbi:MAG: MlaD family protein [Candidatus Spyradenecus sp.]